MKPGEETGVSAFSELLSLSEGDKTARGLLHTPREIAQQPATWETTFALFQRRQAEIRDFLRGAGLQGDSKLRPAVFLLGAGTSDYIGRSLTSLLRRHWQCDVTAVPTTDLLTHFEESLLGGRRYLWISFSRSGDSPESVAVLERALSAHPEIHHVVVSCNAAGRMVRGTAGNRRVLGVCLDDAVNDRGLAMTSSFSNMVVFGQCLAHVESLGEYEGVFRQLVEQGKVFLEEGANCAAELADGGYNKGCFVGSGALRAVASEAALKLVEMTAGKALTMSESSLGLRHGPMAALDADTLFVSFLSGDPRTQKYEADLLEEIGRKRLVRTRAVVGGSRGGKVLAEHHLAVEGIADEYRPPIDVMFGQTLGLFFSLRCGLKPDCPSPTGAINRVVQNVSIYA